MPTTIFHQHHTTTSRACSFYLETFFCSTLIITLNFLHMPITCFYKEPKMHYITIRSAVCGLFRTIKQHLKEYCRNWLSQVNMSLHICLKYNSDNKTKMAINDQRPMTITNAHLNSHQFTATCNNLLHITRSVLVLMCLLWSPYVIGQTIIFSCCFFFFFFLFFLA